ncbi:MAG: hypothetical protein E7650_07555 [Ruminococcaceae bacterium]|nr:hypothetical protein [Oscillospiraceae bacterium]
MQQNFFQAPIPSLHVSGFTKLNEEQLNATAARLGLTMQQEALLTAKKIFTDARHTPTVAELQLLDAMAPRLVEYGTDATVTNLAFDNRDEARVWQDMLCAHEACVADRTTVPTLRGLLCLSSHVLKKAGRHADARGLLCDTASALEAAFLGRSPRLMLDFGAVRVALAPDPAPPKRPQAGLSVLAVRTQIPQLGGDVIARFLQRYAAFAPLPLIAIGEEGLGAQLPHLPVGLEIDLAATGLLDAAALSACCQNTVLIALSPRYVATVMADGAPVTLIGHTLHTPTFTVKNGPVTLTRLPLSLLRSWQHALCRATCHAQAEAPTSNTVQIATDCDHVLGGVSYTGNRLRPLLLLLRDACHAGADMHAATLTATLRLPKNGLSGAVAPLLSYHRFTAELALPTGNTRTLLDTTVTAPTLTVGITAPKRAMPTKKLADLDGALASGDFSALRYAIFEEV